MVFSSLIFLFFFLPLVLAAIYAAPRVAQNFVLLVFSLVFYAWGEPFYILLMLASILFNYAIGFFIVRNITVLTFGVAINLLGLFYFKYAGFLAGNFNDLLGYFQMGPFAVPTVILPLGISFFTFHSISYIVDVYREEVPHQKKLTELALYISLFPQLIAGPIVRYHDIQHQFRESRRVGADKFYEGLQRFVVGLGKKTLLANPMGAVADQVFSLSTQSPAAAWMGILCYTLQIYFDFSGYSDMAIGLAKMFGFEFLENFNYPYISTSIKEFWRRWHISLSSWFRDYLYIPLAGNRASPLRTYTNLLIIFTLCGLWHGASWSFLVWGLWHGSFLILERSSFFPKMNRVVGHIYTLLVVIVGWVFFRAADLTSSVHYIKNMFDIAHFSTEGFEVLTKHDWFIFAVGIVAATPVAKTLKTFEKRFPLEPIGAVVLFAMMLWCVTELASGAYNPFIYFRF